MTEQNEISSDAWSTVFNLRDLKSTIPPQITDRLGKGDVGVNKTIDLLISLTPFASEPSTFSRDAFNKIVAVNNQTGDPLPEIEQQKMLDAALESGFLQKAEGQERYSVRKVLQDAVKRAI